MEKKKSFKISLYIHKLFASSLVVPGVMIARATFANTITQLYLNKYKTEGRIKDGYALVICVYCEAALQQNNFTGSFVRNVTQ